MIDKTRVLFYLTFSFILGILYVGFKLYQFQDHMITNLTSSQLQQQKIFRKHLESHNE